jgi:hypothetical protein
MSYKNYFLTIGNDSDSYTLTYELESHFPAQAWAEMMQTATVETLNKKSNPKSNPWFGIKNYEDLKIKVKRINELIDVMNTWLPEKITSKFDESDYHKSCVKLHVHFPDIEQNEKDPEKLNQLYEFNWAIHLIQSYVDSMIDEKMMLIICPEFTKNVLINDDDYGLFKPSVPFGGLVLHYPLVGQNAFSALKFNDYDCPPDQINPQNIITTYHHLRFFDDPLDNEMYKQRFKEFYDKSTIKQRYNIDDPKLAFGFIKIGQLVTELSKDDVKNIVRSCNKIVSWKIQ